MPAVALPLLLGIVLGRPLAGMMLAAGAISVGFGSFQEFRGSRRLPMLVAAATICVSSWIGTLAGASVPAVLMLTAAVGGRLRPGRRRGTGGRLARAAVSHLAGDLDGLPVARHGRPHARVLRAGRRPPADPGGLDRLVGDRQGSTPRHLRSDRRPRRTPLARHSHRGRAVVSTALARTVPFGNSYWLPMTAAVVTRPELRQTVERGLARTVGMLAGAALSTLVAWALHPHGAAVSGFILTFAGLA